MNYTVDISRNFSILEHQREEDENEDVFISSLAFK